MRQTGESRPNNEIIRKTYRMIFVGLGIAGCSTVLIVGAAIGLGFWLDKQFASAYHLFTIILVLLSVPVTGAALLWVVRFTTKRYRPPQQSIAEDNS